MYCSKKCAQKDILSLEITERKCLVSKCKNKVRGRFNNICYEHQIQKKYCLVCGKSLIKEDKNEK